MIPHEILKELVLNGVRFQYESYDHKKAVEEMEQVKKTASFKVDPRLQLDSWSIPAEIRKNHIMWRIGRLWELTFNKNGEMERFKIGRCHPYIKTFYFPDFGVTVKPMIFKSDDNHDLIGQGLAVEETI